jgi:hypothetical protein
LCPLVEQFVESGGRAFRLHGMNDPHTKGACRIKVVSNVIYEHALVTFEAEFLGGKSKYLLFWLAQSDLMGDYDGVVVCL